MRLVTRHKHSRLKDEEIKRLQEAVSELMEANLRLQARLGQEAEAKVKEAMERNSELSRQLKASQNVVGELIKDGLVRGDKATSKRVDAEREACATLALEAGAEFMRAGKDVIAFAMADLAKKIRTHQ